MARSYRALGLVLLSVSLSACYRYLPMSTPPAPGQEVALVLSDRGRVAVAEKAGSDLDQLRGTLVHRTDSSLTVAMRSALTIRGGVTPWVGESLTVSPALLTSVQTRQLSRSRTALLSTILTTAVVAFIAGNGFGADPKPTETEPIKPPGGPGPSSVRLSTLLSFRSH